MALSDTFKVLFYEAIDIPRQVTVQLIDGAYGTGVTWQSGAIEVSKTLIDARLDALDEAARLRLEELLTEWKTVSTSNVSIYPNNANEGVRLDPAYKRRMIRHRIKTHIGLVISERVHQHGAGGLAVG